MSSTPSASTAGLATTGTDLRALCAGAFAVLALGITLLVGSRRRRLRGH